MNNIKNIGHINLAQNNPTSFEVKPLDMGIVQMQYNLVQKLEREVPENGDFAPVIEKYDSKNPKSSLTQIKVRCDFCKDEDIKKRTRKLLAAFIFENPNDNKEIELVKGGKRAILDYTKSTDFFEEIKKYSKK